MRSSPDGSSKFWAAWTHHRRPRPQPQRLGGRAELAQRMVNRPANPLLARVLVNRIWQTPFRRGDREVARLLWRDGAETEPSRAARRLASEFIGGGWSIKADAPADGDLERLPHGASCPNAVAERLDPITTSTAIG